MEISSVVKIKNLYKKYKGFELSVPELALPKGYATALIGENGAGKTTLLNLLAGIRLDYKGDIVYFEGVNALEGKVRERIGYVGSGNYFLPRWNAKQIEEISEILFDHFHGDRFRDICEELNIPTGLSKGVGKLSDGNRMKLMLAAVLSRDTDFLILDEPASPLDPLMRDKLCDIIRDYLDAGNGEHSVFFSTHNISDMENVTDYAVIMENGAVIEQGFVEDLKEKYVTVKGEAADIETAKKILVAMNKSAYGFEGICPAERLDEMAGMDISVEIPTLSQICVALMKANTRLKLT
ncbi:MAG: ATP-binding cassette domain-containing protein [Acetatifactor sp.]